jgi:hypothetical protein
MIPRRQEGDNMALSEHLQLRADAKKAGIEGYARMTSEELKAALDNLNKSAKQPSGNGGGSKRKSAVVVQEATGGSKRKSSTTATKKAPAAKSEDSGEAKRPSSARKTGAASKRKLQAQTRSAKADTSAGTKRKGTATPGAGMKVQCQVKGCRRRAPARGRYAGYCDLPEHRAQAPGAQGSKRKGTATSTRKSAPSNGDNTRARAFGGNGHEIDVSKIDFSVEWGGGKDGNRKIIFDALRRHKGNRVKVFDKLVEKAREMYPRGPKGKRSKADAEKLLRWMISRVLLDYGLATGQHMSEKRNKAKAKKSSAASAKKTGSNTSKRKPAGSRQSTKKSGGSSASTRKPAGAQTRSGGRKTASSKKGDTSTKKTSGTKRSGRRTPRK